MSDNIAVRITGDAGDLQRALGQGGQAVSNFGRTAQRDLDGVTRNTERATQATTGLRDTLITFAAGGTVLGGFGLIASQALAGGRAIMQAQVQADKLRNTLNFAVGKDSAAGEMVMLRERSRELGLEFISTAQSYARLAAASRGTSMEGRGTREVFDAIAQASVVMGMNVEESEGALRAVQQMMSKGKVQAEELRGQLGERLPGAFQIAARAMGVTTGQLDKMLERGEVFADDFLPRFAAQLKSELGDSTAQAAQSAQAGLNRFENAWTQLKQSVAQSGASQFVGGQLAILGDGMAAVSERMDTARASGSGFTGQMVAASGAVLQFINPLQALSYNALESGNKLDAATARLAELKAMQALPENYGNSFLPRAIKDTEDLIIRLRAARGEQAALLGGGSADVRSQFPSRGQSYANQEKREEADRVKLDAIAQRLSGQSQNFRSDLTELYRQFQAGSLTLERYRALVTDLIKNDGGVKKATEKANPADSVFKGLSERTAELRAQTAAEEDLTAAQKAASKILDDLRTGSLKLTEAEKARMGVALQELLATDAANTEKERSAKLATDNAKIIAKNTESALKEIEQREKSLAVEQEANEKLREEIALIGLDEAGRTARLKLLEQEAIERLELDLIMARNIGGQDAEIARLEREIALRRERIGLLGQKGAKEDAQRWREEGMAAGKDIAGSLTDNLMAGGKSFFDYLKDVARTTTLQPMLAPVAQAGGSFMAGFQNPNWNESKGKTDFLSMGSNLGAMFGAGGLGGSLAAGAGWLTGATTLSGSLTAAGSLIGAGGAGVTAGLGMAAGALGPIALAAMALHSLTKGKGGPKTEGGYGFGVDVRGDSTTAKQITDTIVGTYQTVAASIGAKAGALDVGAMFSMDNAKKGDALTHVQAVAGLNGQQIYNRLDRLGGGDSYKNVARGDDALQAALAEETSRIVLAALQATEGLSDAMRQIIGTTDAYAASIEDVNAVLERAQTAGAERAALEERLFQLTASDSEKLARTRDRERAAADVTNQSLLAQIYAQEDLKAATDSNTAAQQRASEVAREREGLERQLLRLQGNTAELQRRMLLELDPTNRGLQQQIWDLERQAEAQQAAQQAYQQAAAAQEQYFSALRSAGGTIVAEIERLQNANAATRGPAASRALTRDRYVVDLTLARGGDVEASQRVASSAGAFADAATASATTVLEIRRVRAQIVNELKALPATQSYENQVVSTLQSIATYTGGTVSAVQAVGDTFDAAVARLQAALPGYFDTIAGDDMLISLAELKAAVGHVASDEMLAELLRITDTNGDGMISRQEALKQSSAQTAEATERTAASTDYLPYLALANAQGELMLGEARLANARLGLLIDQGNLALAGARQHITMLGGLPAFARGGDHVGGFRWVGERGIELEATGPARIFTAEQIARAMSASAARVADGAGAGPGAGLQVLADKLGDIADATQATAGHTSKSARHLETLEDEGVIVRTETDSPLLTTPA